MFLYVYLLFELFFISFISTTSKIWFYFFFSFSSWSFLLLYNSSAFNIYFIAHIFITFNMVMNIYFMSSMILNVIITFSEMVGLFSCLH